MRIEADDVAGVGDEVREGIDVVVDQPPVAVVDHALDSADIDVRGLRDPLDGSDDFLRRRDGLTVRPLLGALTGQAVRVRGLPSLVLADVRRAEVKAFARRVDVDCVEVSASQRLHARNVTITRRNELLHKGGAVEAQVNTSCFCRVPQFVRRIVPDDARAAPADIGLDDDREPQPFGGNRRERGMIDDARVRIVQAERLQQFQLQGFARLVEKRLPSIEDAQA